MKEHMRPVSVLQTLALCLAGCSSTLDALDPAHDADNGWESGPQLGDGAALARGVPTTPAIGGTLELAQLGSATVAVAADPAGDRVLVAHGIDTALALHPIPLQVGDQPGRMVIDGDLAHVVLRRAGAVATVDLVAEQVIARQQVCPAPRGIDLDVDADLLLVACASGELVTLDAASLEVLSSVQVDRDLRDVVVEDDAIWVSRFRAAEVLELDRDGSVRDVYTAPTFGEHGPSVAWRMRRHPEGGVVVLHQRSQRGDIAGGEGPSTPVYGDRNNPNLATCGGVVHGAITRFQADAAPQTSPPLALAPVPVDLVVLPDDGERYTVVTAGARADTPWQGWLTVFPEAILGPDFADVDCATGEVIELPGAERVVAAARDELGRVVAQTQDGFALVTPDLYPTGVPSDPSDPAGAASYDLFHRDQGRSMACASCHPEGQDDGQVWILPEVGARRTQSVAAGVVGTAPYHWNGEHADLASLLVDVLNGRMGGVVPLGRGIDDLATWLGGLEPVPITPVGDAAEIALGKSLFHDDTVGCASCHSGPMLTNNQTVDVGTGEPLQVPSLRGIGYHGPYLHDGCAETLTDRFGPCGGDRHGQTDHLTGGEIDALVAYLETL